MIDSTRAAGSDQPESGDFASWIEEKSQALKFELGEKFPVTPAELVSNSPHPETSGQKLEEVLLEHEPATAELLEELAALENAPALSDEELAEQALAAGGADHDSKTPE
jgi:hypothetical protein